MTTAARPTFEPARGGTGKGENDLSAISKQYSSRDLPSHTRLKYRFVSDNMSGTRYTVTSTWPLFLSSKVRCVIVYVTGLDVGYTITVLILVR